MLADGDPGARRVDQADRLIGKLAGGDVSVTEMDRRLNGFVENLNLVVLLEDAGDFPHHQNGFLRAGFIDLDDLETTGKSRIFLDVLLVFPPGGGGDGAEGAAGQGRLEELGGIARS